MIVDRLRANANSPGGTNLPIGAAWSDWKIGSAVRNRLQHAPQCEDNSATRAMPMSRCGRTHVPPSLRKGVTADES